MLTTELLKLLFSMSMGFCILVIGILCFSKQQVNVAKYYLLLLLLAMLLSLWNGYVVLSDGKLNHLSVGFLWGYFSWGLGPLLYCYVSAMTQTDHAYPNWCHFLVPLFITTATFILKVSDVHPPKPIEISLFYVLYIQIFAYGVLTIRLLLRYIQLTLAVLSENRNQSLSWLLNLSSAFIFMWIIDMLTTTTNIIGVGPGFVVYQYYLLIESILIICMALFAIKQPKILYSLILHSDVKTDKYNTSQFEDAVAAQLKARLDKLMIEENPALDSELNLATLAEKLDITSHELSQLLNQTYALNFYDFVNQARVERTKMMLADQSFEHLAIIDIALQAGFNNKTTFNRAFRKHMGETPSAYRRAGTFR